MAYDMFVKIGDIKGESQDARHADWIDVLSFHHGMAQAFAPAAGGAGAGKTNFEDFVITKRLDKASPLLMKACAMGQHIPEVDLELVTQQTRAVYMKYTLKDCLVSSVHVTGVAATPDARPVEEVHLGFAQIQWTYTPVTRQGTADAPVDVVWDRLKNK
jgi:type VI secretion system secreted protein Hcp